MPFGLGDIHDETIAAYKDAMLLANVLGIGAGPEES